MFFLAAVALAAAVGLLASQLFAPKPSAVYLRPGLEVYAGPSPDGAARLVLEVYDREGRPVDFSAVLVGPTAGGFAEVGRARGRGRALLPLDRYVAETAGLAGALGHEGEDVRFGLLAIVTRARLENDTAVFETAFAAIPIGPRERGKEVTARLVFNPVHSRAVKLNRTSQAASQGAQAQGPAASGGRTPPQYFDGWCVTVEEGFAYNATVKYIHQYCARWNLTGYWPKNPIRAGLPLITTYITPRDAQNIRDVVHVNHIEISQESRFAVTLTLSIGSLTVILGDAYERTSSTNETLLHLGCIFMNKLEIDRTKCDNLPGFRDKFSANSLLMTGMEGYPYLANYTYVEYRNFTYYNIITGKFRSFIIPQYVGDTGTGVYFFPVERGRGYIPWAEVAQLDSDNVTAVAFQRLLAVTRPVWHDSGYKELYTYTWQAIVGRYQQKTYSINIPLSLTISRLSKMVSGRLAVPIDISIGIDISVTSNIILSSVATVVLNLYNYT